MQTVPFVVHRQVMCADSVIEASRPRGRSAMGVRRRNFLVRRAPTEQFAVARASGEEPTRPLRKFAAEEPRSSVSGSTPVTWFELAVVQDDAEATVDRSRGGKWCGHCVGLGRPGHNLSTRVVPLPAKEGRSGLPTWSNGRRLIFIQALECIRRRKPENIRFGISYPAARMASAKAV